MRAAAMRSRLAADAARVALTLADGDDERAAASVALVEAEADRDAAVAAFEEKRALAHNVEVIELFPQVVQYGSLDVPPVSRC